jgi:hypothetical protein
MLHGPTGKHDDREAHDDHEETLLFFAIIASIVNFVIKPSARSAWMLESRSAYLHVSPDPARPQILIHAR